MSPLESAKVLPCSEDSSLARLVVLLLHQLEELEQHARAPLRVGRGPGRLRRLGVGDRVLDLGLAGEGDLGLHLAGVGVEHVAAAAGACRHLLAADEMAGAHGVDAAEQPVLRRKLRRRQVTEFFGKLEPTRIGLEACGAAHYWARELQGLGHEVSLLPPQHVKQCCRAQQKRCH